MDLIEDTVLTRDMVYRGLCDNLRIAYTVYEACMFEHLLLAATSLPDSR